MWSRSVLVELQDPSGAVHLLSHYVSLWSVGSWIRVGYVLDTVLYTSVLEQKTETYVLYNEIYIKLEIIQKYKCPTVKKKYPVAPKVPD